MPHIAIRLQVSQDRAKQSDVLLFQFVEIREVHTAPVVAGALQDMACHIMLVCAESNFQTSSVMVQMGGSAGPRQALGKASVNLFD